MSSFLFEGIYQTVNRVFCEGLVIAIALPLISILRLFIPAPACLCGRASLGIYLSFLVIINHWNLSQFL
jgi:hypothetical protein